MTVPNSSSIPVIPFRRVNPSEGVMASPQERLTQAASEVAQGIDSSNLVALRGLLLLAFAVGVAGVGSDAVNATSSGRAAHQLLLFLLGCGLGLAVWAVATRRAAALRLFQVLMALLIVSGCSGLVLQWSAQHTAATLLTPATFVQLGALGWLYAYRHPGLRGARSEHRTPLTSL